METLVIDVKEQRDVAIIYVPGDFIQTELPAYKFLLMKIIYEFVDMMCEVNPEQRPYVRYENGKRYCTYIL